MSVQIEKLEKNMARMIIDVPAIKFEKAITQAYNKSKGQISLPGFRKGKVPQLMLEKMYGADMFYEDAANILMPKAYEEATQESDLNIVSMPKVDVTQMEKGKDFIFTAEVAVKPEVILGQYKGIEVEKTLTSVTDEEIDAEIKKAQEQNAREVAVDRAAESGDTVLIDYEGSIDGVLFEGGAAQNHSLVIGSGSFIPGFEDQLIGAKAEDDVEVNVTFPEEYQAKELAGKAALFKCKVHEVKTKEYPKVDDEFAQDVSEFDTLAEYKDSIKQDLMSKKEKDAKNEKQQKVMEAIIENAEMEIPDPMVATQAEQMVDDYSQRLSYQGLSMDQYYQYTGMNAETFKEQMKPQALKNIQSRLVLEAVIDAEGIEASDEELSAEITKMAESYKMEVDKMEEYLSDTERDNMKKDIAAQKALEFVTDAAVETE